VSSGRRLALARWIASKDNPLTARVAINDIWMHHFGKPLVSTVANFGLSGKPPSHPELLDWLAVQFMDRKWSMKAVHRLIVTSNTYRMESDVRNSKDPNIAIDGENRYLWRMNSHRMAAETLRDSVLYVGGQLDPTIGGPSVDEAEGKDTRTTSNSHRRGIYLWQTFESRDPFLKLFDVANPTECYQRTESVVPQQALAMANSRLTLEQSRRIAAQLSQKLKTNHDPATFITLAFETVLDRPPSAEEITKSEEFLAQQSQLLHDPAKLTLFKGGQVPDTKAAADPELRAEGDLVHVLFNSNEFVTIR
jgi:hypothetical protein